MPTAPTPSNDLPQPSRFIVGIDLGTTNSAVGYVDTDHEPWRVETFRIPQLVDVGQLETLETLPSFHYQPVADEATAAGLRLPWSRETPPYTVGVFAREQGSRAPARLIGSAKSWLCHSGVDRTADLLPWQGAADVERLSPVAASARYLRHIRDAWNAQFKGHPLQDQDIVLTLPASFDEVARELTVQAAAAAGLPRVVLIEEPQAAFYAWLDAHHQDWEQRVEPGQKILVCDIGGGTTDFTLIRVRHGEGDKVQFHRVAVGDHLILGGDNQDLALAKHLEDQLGGSLQPHQWAVLVRICRRLKEEVLIEDCPPQLTFNLPGSGAKLIGGGVRVEVDRDQVRPLLLDGFFPFVGLDDKPRKLQSGFREFGLPYAPDPAVTRYLAAFLTAHRHAGQEQDAGEQGRAGGADPARPDIVLLNGGVFNSPLVRQRLLDVLQSWFRAGDPNWSPILLDNDRLDLAVAHGAAYYGTVRRGRGVRIAAGLARTYYIGVESDPPSAVCLVPGNAEPGQAIDLVQRRFELLVHQPAEFPLYVSSTRLTDVPGELLPVDREQMKPLPPIRTVLRTRGKKLAGTLSVHLHARLTEIGTLDLWCSEADSDRRWRLQFDVRSATQTDKDAQQTAGEAEGVIEEEAWQRCEQVIAATFGAAGCEKPDGLIKRLAAALDLDRNEWPMSLLRRIWETLLEHESGRRKSAEHEARWLNLLGFALRPGYGLAVDDWRVSETWRIVQGKLVHSAGGVRSESWILWRRIAGGLSSGQQRSIADPLLAAVRSLHRRTTAGKGSGDVGFTPQQSVEMWRLLAGLELLPVGDKTELGDMLVELMSKKSMQPARGAMIWALGRIGTRQPLYGPLNTVVPAEAVKEWLDKLVRTRQPGDLEAFSAMQIARRTGDRYRDLDDSMRREIVDWMQSLNASPHLVQLVQEGGTLDREEQGRAFGEAVPKGLRIQ
jgi:molecular chaperone DnaK (HSP70)